MPSTISTRPARDTRRHSRAGGPLAGVPWASKDTFDVAALPATPSSRLRRRD
jgi:Asp-tRNA(Asn)/Glu-tRNA(Gln) amidotransferase A subunit family amidase